MDTDILTIDDFKDDGFTRVCSIDSGRSSIETWHYKDIDDATMYDVHGGWVYLISVDLLIVKVGETGMPLGRRRKNGDQPLTGTTTRLGRYRSHKDYTKTDTDHWIRTELQPLLDAGHTVSFWVKKCENPDTTAVILGETVPIKTQYHKIVEKIYLNKITEIYGELPLLNKLTG